MTDQYRDGEHRNERYRQENYRADDYRSRDQNQSHGARGGQDYRAERFGQSYEGQSYGGQSPGGSEGRSFSDNGGYNPYANATYGGSYGEDRGPQYGLGQYGSGQYGGGYRGDDHRPYSDRQAAGAMMHQGARSQENDAQRYQYNNYRPTHDTAGRYAHAGAPGTQYGAQAERGFWDQTRDEVSSWFGDDQAAQRRRMDEVQAGQHSGKGPKGYTRSDDRIREDLNDRLTDDHRLDASDIDVKVDKGEVTLTGHVSQRADKRRAEDIAETIGGVKHVQNNLRVKDNAAATPTYGASGAEHASTATVTGTSAPRSN